ncbi:MAG: hypothetical protein ACO1OB_08495 [Archangium sp.]
MSNTPWSPEPQSFESLVVTLADFGRRMKRGESVTLPHVGLLLRSGRELVGSVVDLHEGRHGAMTVFLQCPTSRFETELIAVPFASIDAISFKDLPAVQATVAKEPPTPMALSRKAKVVADKYAGLALEVERGADDAALLGLGKALDALESVLSSVAADDLGRESLAKVKRISIRIGAALEVIRGDGELTVVVPSKDGTNTSELKPRVEAVL